MKEILALVAAGYMAYAALNVWKRPGLLVSVCFNSYGLAVFFGTGIGGAFGLFGALAAILYQTSNAGAQKLDVTSAELALFAWALFASASVLVSWQPDLALEGLGRVLVLSGAMYVICRIQAGRPGFFDDVLLGSCFGAVLVIPGLITSQQTLGRLSVGQLQPVGLSEVADVPIIAIFLLLFFRPDLSKFVRFSVALLLFSLLVPFIAVVSTRGLLIGAAAVAVSTLCLALWHYRNPRILVNTVLVSAVAVLASYIAWGFIEQSKLGLLVIVGAERLFGNFGAGGVVLDVSALSRLYSYQEAWNLFLDAPLFGNGIGAFVYMVDFSTIYPHNMELQLLSEFGIVGTALFGWGLTSLGWRAIVAALRRPPSWQAIFILLLLIVKLAGLQVSGDMESEKVFYAVLAMIAAALPRAAKAARLSAPGLAATPS